jgi:hypothetical protein
MGRRKLTRILLEIGINAALRNKQAETALDIALRKNLTEIAAILQAAPPLRPADPLAGRPADPLAGRPAAGTGEALQRGAFNTLGLPSLSDCDRIESMDTGDDRGCQQQRRSTAAAATQLAPGKTANKRPPLRQTLSGTNSTESTQPTASMLHPHMSKGHRHTRYLFSSLKRIVSHIFTQYFGSQKYFSDLVFLRKYVQKSASESELVC